MSRDRFQSKDPRSPGATSGVEADPVDEAIVIQADALFADNAASAIALCGIEAWLEEDETEFRRFARVFRRMRN